MTHFNTAVYATIPNHKSAQLLYSGSARDWYAVFVDANDSNIVWRVRGTNPTQLKDTIKKKYPTAVFSEVEPQPKQDEIRAQLQRLRDDRPVGTMVVNDRVVDEIEYADLLLLRAHGRIINGQRRLPEGLEVTLDMCRRQGIRDKVFEALRARAEQARENDVMREHDTNVAGLSPDQAKQFTERNVQLLVAQGPDGWKEWFAARPGFLTWPNNSGQNKQALLEWSRQMGYIVPVVRQLQEGMLYLLDHGQFHLQSSYKRSEQHVRDSVQPLTRIETANESVSQDEINRAVTALTAKFGLPLRVTLESLRAEGVPNAEKVFAALQAKYDPQSLNGMSATQLKEYGRDMRNQARGNQPMSRLDVRKQS